MTTPQQQSDMPAVDMEAVLDSAGEYFGLHDIPAEYRDLLLGDMSEVIIQSTLLTLLENGSDADVIYVSELLAQDLPAEDLFTKLEERFPNFSAIVAQEVQNFKEGMGEVEGEK